MSCVGIVLNNGTFLSLVREQPIVLATAWVLGGAVHVISLDNNLIECKSVPLLEAWFGNERWSVETPYAPFSGDLTRITFIYFRKFPLYYVSISPLKYPRFAVFFGSEFSPSTLSSFSLPI